MEQSQSEISPALPLPQTSSQPQPQVQIAQEYVSPRYLPTSEPQPESKVVPHYTPVPISKRITFNQLLLESIKDRRAGSASPKEMNAILNNPKIRHLSLSGEHLLSEKQKLDYAAIQAANMVAI